MARPVHQATGGFAAEAGRYHLYVSLACPWAHRTLDLPQAQGTRGGDLRFRSSTRTWAKNGWEFRDRDGGTIDHLGDASTYLWQVYVAAKPDYSGRVTVPGAVGQEKRYRGFQRILGNHPHVQLRLQRDRPAERQTTIPPHCVRGNR
jgi:glutathionyl-hydroquinone reductase